MVWDTIASRIQQVYGVYVSFEKGNEFFICPECDEPILKEDYNQDKDFTLGHAYYGTYYCPICEEPILGDKED